MQCLCGSVIGLLVPYFAHVVLGGLRGRGSLPPLRLFSVVAVQGLQTGARRSHIHHLEEPGMRPFIVLLHFFLSSHRFILCDTLYAQWSGLYENSAAPFIYAIFYLFGVVNH